MNYEDYFEIEHIDGPNGEVTMDEFIAEAMRDALKCDGLNLVQNNGEIAGQTVNHFHLHLIPRYEGDGLNLNWPQQEISAEQLEEIRQSIKKSI